MTDEPPALVDKWIAANHPGYPIVSLDKSGTDGKSFEQFLGVKYFPWAAVIDPEGKVVYSGSAGSVASTLKDALKHADKGALYPKELSKAVKLYRSDDLMGSWKELSRTIDKGKLEEDDAAAAEAWKACLAAAADGTLASAKDLADKGLVWRAHEQVAWLAEADPALPSSQGAQELMKSLEEHPAWKQEKRADKVLVDAEEAEQKVDFEKAFDLYKKVKDHYEGTRAAEYALAQAKGLLERGCIGYDPNCPACRSGKGRACDKHRKTPKL